MPVFRLARQRGIQLVALNVDSAAMEKVRLGGFENLPQEERDRYVEDKKGFISFSRTPGFRDYVEVGVWLIVTFDDAAMKGKRKQIVSTLTLFDRH